MKDELFEYFEKYILVLVAFFIIVIGIPLLIIYLPFGIYESYKFEKKFKTFLNKLEGKNFFIYNNRKKSINFIELNVLPTLSKNIELLYLKKRELDVNTEKELYSTLIYRINNYTRFPHLIKLEMEKLKMFQ